MESVYQCQYINELVNIPLENKLMLIMVAHIQKSDDCLTIYFSFKVFNTI